MINKTNKLIMLAAVTLIAGNAFAGNKDRSAQAGANELQYNPWARSSGFANANAATVRGLESQFLNVAGMAFTKKTELLFSNTSILPSAGIKMNAFGFSQKVGKTGVMAMSVNSLNFGQIDITTVDNPEGGLGKFSVQYNTINLSYAKEFSNSIFGGITVKAISQSIPSVSAKGVAVDAGIQYLNGNNEEKNNIHFGITLKNVGPPMKYSGNGLTVKRESPSSGQQMTVEQRSALIELPTSLNISGAYDFALAELHRLTVATTFISNSFTQNVFNTGVEYGFKDYFMLRAGYSYENGITSAEKRNNLYTGPTAGFTFETPFNKNGSTFGLDYAYRATNPFNGVHSIGVRINL